MQGTTLSGGCSCGFIRYDADAAPFNSGNCHCSMCRKAAGAPFVTWFSVPRSSLRIVRGELASFASSDHARRSFCPRCGTQLTFASNRYPDEIDITTCSLDEPERVPPVKHTYVSTRLSWIKLSDGLPEFSASSTGASDQPTSQPAN